jgi:hypothetical protein
MRVIIETLRNLMAPLMGLLFVQYQFYYFYATLGNLLFGGKIYPNQPAIKYSSDIPSEYYLLNFNDLMSAYVTLFALMVVNNWMVVANMYAVVCNTNQVRWFFLSFYYFSVMIGINILIGFAIDMYGAIERMDLKKEENMKKLNELAKEKDENLFFKKKEEDSPRSSVM